MNKKQNIIHETMFKYALHRCKIPNANNGRAYMSCLVLDKKYCFL